MSILIKILHISQFTSINTIYYQQIIAPNIWNQNNMRIKSESSWRFRCMKKNRSFWNKVQGWTCVKIKKTKQTRYITRWSVSIGRSSVGCRKIWPILTYQVNEFTRQGVERKRTTSFAETWYRRDLTHPSVRMLNIPWIAVPRCGKSTKRECFCTREVRTTRKQRKNNRTDQTKWTRIPMTDPGKMLNLRLSDKIDAVGW